AAVWSSLNALREPAPQERLSPILAERLYGQVLRTSVSRMEQFAACPFKFFVHSGMRAEERRLFELDVKEQGSFQHDVLALFHEQLRSEHKRWRDLTPAEARARVAAAAAALVATYREGLLDANDQTRFMARAMTESLQDFVEILVVWMLQQYAFDPVHVELPFGENEAQPAWTIDLGQQHQLQLYGRIDRVDLFRKPGAAEALCVVVDYKSSQKRLDEVLMAHGLQLQLLTYLNVLRDWPHPEDLFGVSRLVPSGVFYVNLRGRYSPGKNRTDALADQERDRKLAYRHAGRFDVEALPYLDSRTGPRKGDQFNFRVLKDGRMHKSCREPQASAEFIGLLDAVKRHLADMGRKVYLGMASLDPYRKGNATACDQCAYRWICRIDPWTHRYRVLQSEPKNHDSDPAD
ncbi:MAG TPA: PD-(D/E)XK nuclease family protein, partial [Verrucomicrobiae bacterium]